MRTSSISLIEWYEGGKDRLVWKFPEKNIAWNSTLVIHENQAAALFTGNQLFGKRLKLYDMFTEVGKYVLSPSTVPALLRKYPESISRTHFSCVLIYCSTKEQTYCVKIHTGDSFGQGWVHAEAVAECKFKIMNPEAFMKNVVAYHKKTSNDCALTYLDKLLGDELFRQHPPYDWVPRQKIPLLEICKNIGIELLSLKFEYYKQYAGGVGV